MVDNTISQGSAHDLSVMLADTYILYLKTQNFHWNVIDPRFQSLHKLFEHQYEELAEAVDGIAERIRTLDQRAPGTMHEFLDLTRLKEPRGVPSGDEMIKELAKDHQSISQFLNHLIEESLKNGDQGSADLMIERIRVHDKAAWMLKSHLKK